MDICYNLACTNDTQLDLDYRFEIESTQTEAKVRDTEVGRPFVTDLPPSMGYSEIFTIAICAAGIARMNMLNYNKSGAAKCCYSVAIIRQMYSDSGMEKAPISLQFEYKYNEPNNE